MLCGLVLLNARKAKNVWNMLRSFNKIFYILVELNDNLVELLIQSCDNLKFTVTILWYRFWITSLYNQK